jgi:Flp pilus assembly protein TadG
MIAITSTQRLSRPGRRGNGGQTLIEFALCLPLLLLIVTGIFTFGFTFNNYLTLTDAVNVGGRALAISRGHTTDPCATAATAIANAAALLNARKLSYSVVLNGNRYSGATCSSGNSSSGAAGDMVQGTTAVVTATYPCDLSVYGVRYSPGCTLTARVAELVQ